jgi:hypothetical protein
MVRSLAVILAVALSQLATSRVPRIEAQSSGPLLVLPDAMAQALRNCDPDFKPRRMGDYPSWIQKKARISAAESPFAVVGDFNADKVLDVVIDGDNRVSGRRLVIMSAGTGFRVSEVEKEPRAGRGGVGVGLSLVRPGTIRSQHENRPLVLKTDAFEVTYFEASAKVVYFSADSWHDYWTSD